MRTLIILTILSAFLACSKSDYNVTTFLDCIDNSDDYKIYTGEDLDCQFYYTLTEYNDQKYIELGSRCADLTRPFVINENCEDICANDPYNENSACGKYLSGREIIKVLLIEK